MITWKANIYNSSDSLLLNTNIFGLKLKAGSSNTEIPITDLSTPIRIEIPVDKDSLSTSSPQSIACVYFNQTTGKWGDEGCSFGGYSIKSDGSKFGICLCTHLTDFSISNAFYSAFGDSGFQYFGDAGSIFGNADFSSLKVFYVLIALMICMLFFMVYGHYADKQSKFTSNTLLKRTEVLKLGINMKRSQEPKPIKLRLNKGIQEKSKVGVNTREMRVRSRMGQDQDEEETTRPKLFFLDGYCHAVKKSHNLLSIFQKYNPSFKRPSRFWLYFVRFYGMLAVSSIFYTQTKVDKILGIICR
jgi:GPCR proteolysis site, GPS, motif